MPKKTLHLDEGKAELKKIAGKPFKSVEEVWKVMERVVGGRYGGLENAAKAVWGDRTLEIAESVRQAALNAADKLSVLPTLEDGEGALTVSMTRVEARRFLALSFFEKFPQMQSGDTHWGSMSWASLYRQPCCPVSVSRLMCLLHYFKVTSDPGWGSGTHPLVTFTRVREDGVINWDAENEELTIPEVVLSTEKRIEDCPEAGCQVDFANKNLQIHKIIPSATQEEVMFSVRPELMLSLPIFSTLLSDEAAVMTGAAMYCDYTGYLDTFRFKTGVTPEVQPPVIIAIDAVVAPQLQYKKTLIDRDLRKAYAGFKSGVVASSTPGISTGNWGCGAFGGDVILKFCQQLIAASHSHAAVLYYSTFKNPPLEVRLRKLVELIRKSGTTPSKLYELIQGYSGECNALLGMEVLAYHLPKSNFEEYLNARLEGGSKV